MLSELSDDVIDFVFLHEIGHKRLPLVLRVLILGLLVITTMIAVLSIPTGVVLVLQTALTTGSVSASMLAVVAAAIVTGTATGVFMVISWIDEGLAEWFALRNVGVKQYVTVTRELRQRSESERIERVLHRLRYPPPRFILWLWRLR